ncbi:MAG: hypothetical protein ACOY9D_00430 [Pseudomonadota bacterium]
MKTTMDMNSYEIEQDAMEIEYGEEIMSAGWNPAVDLVCEQLLQIPTDEQMALAAELPALNSVEDVSAAVSEIFLRKMYSYQR